MEVEIVNWQDKKPKKKFHLWEKIFIIISLIFILGCIIFYGNRLIKYYKVYNPKIDDEKVELLMNAIVRTQEIVYENDGLYRINGMYVYKGSNVNNYLRYSNMLFRIIKFNIDGSLDLVLDDDINMLKWDTEIDDFVNSDIFKYLNNHFYKLLDDTYLTNTIICNDVIDDLENMTCQNTNTNSYIRLLTVSEYLNSKTDTTYITDTDNIWLSSRAQDGAWNINNGNLSLSDVENMYYVRPVITIKNSAFLLSGDGTKSNPYTISENELGVGSYVKLDEDLYYVYDTEDDNYKLSLASVLDTKKAYNLNSTKFDLDDENSLAYYLNNEYYESLSYKDKLLDFNWYAGEYDNITGSIIKSKIGLLNVNDIKLTLDDYYLMTPNEDKIYLYSNSLVDSKPNLLRSVVPTIALDNIDVVSGKGTKEDPYVVGV